MADVQNYPRLHGWRRILGHGGYPVVLALVLAGAVVVMRGTTLSPAATAGVFLVVSTLAVWALEGILPFDAAWKPGRKTFWLNLTHTLLSAAAVGALVRATMLAATIQIGVWVSAMVGGSLWPTSWPLVFQAALAILIGDLGAYLGHRWMHKTRLGWRLHVVHHSPEGLHVFAAGRSHPLNVVLTLTLESIPVLLMGVSAEALAIMTLFKGVNGQLQHANIDFRPGWLSTIIATCDVHRWHHSQDLGESNTNFGNATMIWDRIFGTFFLPRKRRPTTTVGLAKTDIPEHYMAHLGAPFVLERYERQSDPPPSKLVVSPDAPLSPPFDAVEI